jgi:hypothetical protein
VYILDCGHHVGYRLPDSVRRRPGTALRCRACHLDGSRLWQLALSILQPLWWWLGMLDFERVLIPGLQKRFDIYLQAWGIAIEVDGPQHFHGTCYGTPAEVQYAWDRRVDEECKRVGQRLVRLHYADTCEWASTVLGALFSQEVVIYTSSYGL